jgi:hypothetical protein
MNLRAFPEKEVPFLIFLFNNCLRNCFEGFYEKDCIDLSGFSDVMYYVPACVCGNTPGQPYVFGRRYERGPAAENRI